jgi:hypothetical protein
MKGKEVKSSDSYLIRGIIPGFLIGTEENTKTTRKRWMIRAFTATDEALQIQTGKIFIRLEILYLLRMFMAYPGGPAVF